MSISRERKEIFRSNKKYFSQFLKGHHLIKNKKIVDISFDKNGISKTH